MRQMNARDWANRPGGSSPELPGLDQIRNTVAEHGRRPAIQRLYSGQSKQTLVRAMMPYRWPPSRMLNADHAQNVDEAARLLRLPAVHLWEAIDRGDLQCFQHDNETLDRC